MSTTTRSTLFREVNERISELADSWGADTRTFLCECDRNDCTKTIELTRAEYQAVRAEPTRFVVLLGHALSEHESVVARRGDYLIVEKIGAQAREAVEHDPRAEAPAESSGTL